MGVASADGVTINGIRVADWAAAEYRKKRRVERRGRLRCQVRSIFVLLGVLTVLLFAYNHQTEIQRAVSAVLAKIGKPAASDSIRNHALKYEDEVNQAGQ
jgi:hypothetical protein